MPKMLLRVRHQSTLPPERAAWITPFISRYWSKADTLVLWFFTALLKRKCGLQWHFCAPASTALLLDLLQTQMPDFSHDNLRFHFLDCGTGAPIVFQHGLGGDAERVLALLGPLPGFRMLGLDCRGHGKTVPLGSVEKL